MALPKIKKGNPPYQYVEAVPLNDSQRMIVEEQYQIAIPMEERNGTNDEPKQQIVDFVLVYIKNGNSAHDEKREVFEKSLRAKGLLLEYEQNQHLHFVKIHAPQEVLCQYSDILKLRMPIKTTPDDDNLSQKTTDIIDDARTWLVQLFQFVQLKNPKLRPQKYRLSTEFSRDKDYLFNIDDNFFTSNARSMVVDFILEREPEGMQRLLVDGVYCAAYPLHDGSYKEEITKEPCTRALLYKEWGSTSKWLKLQPLDTIKDYFGVNFAMYFAWLGFYTYMLIPASIAGLLCFFYGLLTLSSNTLANDACSDWAGDVVMCPQCDKRCDYWRLNETCLLTKVTHLFDNPATTVFAVFMSFWSILYLELWRRRSAELSHHWGLAEWDLTAEHPRPQYQTNIGRITKYVAVKQKINSITKERESHVSFWKVRFPATFFSFSVVLSLAAVAVAAVFAVVLYRMAMITSNSIFGHEFDSTNYKTFALPAIAAVINLVCILVLNVLYDWLAVYLTEMELLRTQAEFDDSLTLKVYIFQFVNYYASIFYVAFLKGKFVGYPKKYNRILHYRQEECSPGGCLMELCIQLVIIMVGKQALYTAMEMILPVLYKWWALFRIHTGLKQKEPITTVNQWTRDFKLLDWGPRGLYDEYLEMVIQFGFITLFVVAFPLAPLFALANNVLEMRLDATKFLRHYRRPVPRRARDIGIWARILDALARISVMTSAFIIAFSSNLIPRLVYMASPKSNHTDIGFLNDTLSYFNIADFENNTEPVFTSFGNITECRYTDYRNPPTEDRPYKRHATFWHVLAARLAFVVVYQTVVGLVIMAVQWCLAGNPRKLRDCIKQEACMVERQIIERETARARERLFENIESSDVDNAGQSVRMRNARRTNRGLSF